MAFLDYQHWLLLATLILATLIAGRIRVRGTAEHTGRRRQELEVLYEPKSKSDADKDVLPSGRKSDHTVEYVFASQSLV
jgi:hypothetical protein